VEYPHVADAVIEAEDRKFIEFCVSNRVIAHPRPLTYILSPSGGEDIGEGDVSD